MLERFVLSAHKQRRLADGPFAEVLELLAVWLERQGYSRWTGANWFRRIIHFHRWFRAKRLADDALERRHVEQYLDELPRRHRPGNGKSNNQNGQRTVFRVALALLEEKRVGRTGTPITKMPSVLDGFESHLRQQCALSPSSIRCYLRWIRRLHDFAFGSPEAAWRRMKPTVLMEFLQLSAQTRKPMGCVGLTSAVRNYFRFLQLCGHRVDTLLDALPWMRRSSRSLPERILTQEQVQLWLGGINRSTAEGRRDYAMALCLCDLGLRVGDLARLTLDDLDWRRGAIRVPNGKRKRPYWLPLSLRVGKAIAAYVRHDRPKTDRREIFVRHRTPRAQPLASWNIQARLQKVAREQGLPRPLTGTHALRHTVATRVYEKGTPLKEVADLLGHDNIKSTVVYAKLNERELAEIALPWPEVLS